MQKTLMIAIAILIGFTVVAEAQLFGPSKPETTVLGQGLSFDLPDYDDVVNINRFTSAEQTKEQTYLLFAVLVVLLAALYAISNANKKDVIVQIGGVQKDVDKIQQFQLRHTDPAIQAIIRNQEQDNQNQNTSEAQKNTANVMSTGAQLAKP